MQLPKFTSKYILLLIISSSFMLHLTSPSRLLQTHTKSSFFKQEIEKEEFDLIFNTLKNLSIEQVKELKQLQLPDLEKQVPLTKNENKLIQNLLSRLKGYWEKNQIADFDRCFNLYDQLGVYLYGNSKQTPYKSKKRSREFNLKTSAAYLKCRKMEGLIHAFVKENASEISFYSGFEVSQCEKFRKNSILCLN